MVITLFNGSAIGANTPYGASMGVYARRKGGVKRKGVISRGCEANRIVGDWQNERENEVYVIDKKELKYP
jgi:hypothetical protein